MRGRGKPETRGHAHTRSKSRTVQTHRPRMPRRRGDVLRFLVDIAHGGFRIDQRFVRVHRAHLELRLRTTRETMLLAQLPAHFRQQRVLDGQREIVDPDARRVQLAARAAYRDQRLFLFDAPRDQRGFGAHAVDCIDHVIKTAAERRREIVRLDEVFHQPHVAERIDCRDAFGHRFDFRFSVVTVQRMDLAVSVALGDIVQIDQGQRADRTARQCLCYPRTHPADADHGDVCAFKRSERRRAVQPGNAAEAPRAVGGFAPVEAGSKIRRRGGTGHSGRLVQSRQSTK
ncbi:hypothetical protein KCU90_g1484, partial [Aureobasidium melanogenum]